MSAATKAGDKATVTITVAVDRAAAFDVFTRETDLWWKRGPMYRMSGRTPGTLIFEPREGGRLFESHDSPSGKQLFEYGRIKVWQPPERLVFEWRNANFAANEVTEVEVLFDEIDAGNTRVTLHHRGWASLRPDHPARHNLEAAAFSRMIGMWWADLLNSYRERTIP
jgi:uncharacterized protein YndB with AHSA1/START domain